MTPPQTEPSQESSFVERDNLTVRSNGDGDESGNDKSFSPLMGPCVVEVESTNTSADDLNGKFITDSSDMNLQVKGSGGRNGFKFASCIQTSIIGPRTALLDFLNDSPILHDKIKPVVPWILALCLAAYLGVSLSIDFKRAQPLLVICGITLLCKLSTWVQSRNFECAKSICDAVGSFYDSHRLAFKNLAFLVLGGLLAFWIYIDTIKRPEQLISLLGYFVFLFLLFLCSKYPQHVQLRPVIWGCTIQLTLAFVVLRTEWGFEFFQWLGDIVQIFINYVDVGVKFVFGKSFHQHFFAFKVLSIVIYFSSFISILYYLGAMQWLIGKIAWLMQKTLGTSPTESMVAAGNIFVGQTEAPLLIRPYIDDLTTSELHSVMVCGFGTVSGSVLGAYLGFGIKPVYVITACVMAAPCALAVTKIVYPETKQSKFTSPDGLKLEKGKQRNIIEAASGGASDAIGLVLNIAANIVAFLSLLAAVNGFLEWFSGLVNIKLNFQIICSYIFMPIAFLIGVPSQFTMKVGELIGTKVFINEFIAYQKLSEMIDARDSGLVELYSADGIVNWVDERTEAIVTYALCGFANFGSLGIMLGGLTSIAPQRKGEISKIILRALICGVFVSILNACVAGFLYTPVDFNCNSMFEQNFGDIVLKDRLYNCCERLLDLPLVLNTTKGEFQMNCQSTFTSIQYAVGVSHELVATTAAAILSGNTATPAS